MDPSRGIASSTRSFINVRMATNSAICHARIVISPRALQAWRFGASPSRHLYTARPPKAGRRTNIQAMVIRGHVRRHNRTDELLGSGDQLYPGHVACEVCRVGVVICGGRQMAQCLVHLGLCRESRHCDAMVRGEAGLFSHPRGMGTAGQGTIGGQQFERGFFLRAQGPGPIALCFGQTNYGLRSSVSTLLLPTLRVDVQAMMGSGNGSVGLVCLQWSACPGFCAASVVPVEIKTWVSSSMVHLLLYLD